MPNQPNPSAKNVTGDSSDKSLRHPEMIEGQEAFDRFRTAVKATLTVPKSAFPPSPFGRSGVKKRKH
jgi:hypothetical protein